MNAQENLIKYAEKAIASSNIEHDLTPQQFIGKAAIEGVVLYRGPNTRTWCNVTRQGKTIIVTETTLTKTNKVENETVITVEDETTTEVLRLEL